MVPSPMNKITLCYGPNECLGVYKRHPQRLNRLTTVLTTLGFEVSLEPINDRDRLIIKLNGEPIFRCRLSFLRYQPDAKHDETLSRAVFAALEACARFQLAIARRTHCV
ncbi:uncharacterized protein LOC119648655 [Hermetia illucens]|uniref:uncharacterized protein LOC119648655 n=1 Tax=Hermetia illucens TaxID=343691 RepID=UPI0018CC165D|nr:uncharacterized protein LOC119648655 [Hermetia illucens]